MRYWEKETFFATHCLSAVCPILISNHLSCKILENLDSLVPQPTFSWKWHPDTCQLGNLTKFGQLFEIQCQTNRPNKANLLPDWPASFTSWTFSSVIRIWILYLMQGLCAKSVQWSYGQLDKAVFSKSWSQSRLWSQRWARRGPAERRRCLKSHCQAQASGPPRQIEHLACFAKIQLWEIIFSPCSQHGKNPGSCRYR